MQLLPKETRRGRSRTGPIISTALSPEAYEKNIKRPITKPEGPTLRETLKGKVKEYAPEMVDSYAAYGVTEQLLKECMAPGEYEIPAEMVKAGEIPTDGEGTHVGVGIGWWYEGELKLRSCRVQLAAS